MRFHGKVGFGETVEESPGVFVEAISEFDAYGDVTQGYVKQVPGQDLNPDRSVSNMIHIMMSSEAQKNFMNLKYVEWAGTRWVAESVELQPPRLLIRLGEVYSGPTP